MRIGEEGVFGEIDLFQKFDESTFLVLNTFTVDNILMIAQIAQPVKLNVP